MRILRITIAALFVVTLGLYIYFTVQHTRSDKTYPVITLDSDTITVPVEATDEDMLAGVHAYDGKDGDISDRVIVESISRFTERGVSIIKYAVCDNDNHVSTAKRSIVFDNYTSPHFTLSSSLLFGVSQPINLRKIIGASDKIDGDISNKVIITADEYSSSTPGGYTFSAKVSNSKGDMISLSLPVYVEEMSLSAPVIELKDYLVYIKKGEEYDVKGNIESVLDSAENDLSADVVIDTNISTKESGLYEAHYRVEDSQGRIGHSILIVIVEE